MIRSLKIVRIDRTEGQMDLNSPIIGKALYLQALFHPGYRCPKFSPASLRAAR
jgi:hypothetical protein